MSFRSPALETLRVFEACARHGSYTRAAAELGISPAAVSQRMRNLRAELGTTLFDRIGPRVTLTEAGHRLAGKVREAMAQLEAAVTECVNPNVIRVSAAPTFASRWLAPRLAGFTERHGIAVLLDPSIELRGLGSFDVAVRSGLGNWKGYSATLVCRRCQSTGSKSQPGSRRRDLPLCLQGQIDGERGRVRLP